MSRYYNKNNNLDYTNRTAHVNIDPDTYAKLMHMAQYNSAEAACFVRAEKTGTGQYHVYGDILIPPQLVTGVSVDVDPYEYALWCTQIDDIENVRCHAHSHVNMNVFSSSTDDSYQADQMKQVQDFYIFIIVNKQENVFIKIYDVEDSILYEDSDITYAYLPNVPDVYAKVWDTQVKTAVPVHQELNKEPKFNYQQYKLQQIYEQNKDAWDKEIDEWI